MTAYEFDAKDTYGIGRGGIKLPELAIKEGDFYPHDTVSFLEKLWHMNQVESNIGQPNKDENTGYFVVPATEDRPVVFAFGEVTRGDHPYDSPITTYQFFTPPTESGSFQPIMSFTHRSSRNCGFAGGRDSLALVDHEGQTTEIALFGYRDNGIYKSDEFANYSRPGEYTYDSPESQESLKVLANKTRELQNLLS